MNEVPIRAKWSGNFDLPLAGSEWTGKLEVFVDGIQYDDVFAYDIEAGWLAYYLRDDEGYFYLDPDCPDRASQRIVTGKVEVRLKEPAE